MRRKSNPWLAGIWLWVALAGLSACRNTTLYHAFRPVPVQGWRQTDTLRFPVSVSDTVSVLRLSVDVRHTNAYPYQNLYLFVEGDTVECRLSDRQGRWVGKGLSASYQSRFLWRRQTIPHADTVWIRISHGMSDPLLRGVQDVGLCVERPD